MYKTICSKPKEMLHNTAYESTPFWKPTLSLYPECPHRQGGYLACCGCTFESSWGCNDLYYARGAQAVLVWDATSQLDLPSLTALSLAGCGWLQLGVPH